MHKSWAREKLDVWLALAIANRVADLGSRGGHEGSLVDFLDHRRFKGPQTGEVELGLLSLARKTNWSGGEGGWINIFLLNCLSIALEAVHVSAQR